MKAILNKKKIVKGTNIKVPLTCIPTNEYYEGKLINGEFYLLKSNGTVSEVPITPKQDIKYKDVTTGKTYEYDGSNFIEIIDGGGDSNNAIKITYPEYIDPTPDTPLGSPIATRVNTGQQLNFPNAWDEIKENNNAYVDIIGYRLYLTRVDANTIVFTCNNDGLYLELRITRGGTSYFYERPTVPKIGEIVLSGITFDNDSYDITEELNVQLGPVYTNSLYNYPNLCIKNLMNIFLVDNNVLYPMELVSCSDYLHTIKFVGHTADINDCYELVYASNTWTLNKVAYLGTPNFVLVQSLPATPDDNTMYLIED